MGAVFLSLALVVITMSYAMVPEASGARFFQNGRSAGTRAGPVEGTAVVSPDQSWTEDGTADVTPIAPFPATTTRNLPLEHRAPPGTSAIVVTRMAYPQGLVVIWTDSEVSGDPAQLGIIGTSGNSIMLGPDDHQDMPNGVIAWFLS